MREMNRYRVVAEQHRSEADAVPLPIKVDDAVVLPVQSHQKIDVVTLERKRVRRSAHLRDRRRNDAWRSRTMPASHRDSKPVCNQLARAPGELEAGTQRIQCLGAQLFRYAMQEGVPAAFEHCNRALTKEPP